MNSLLLLGGTGGAALLRSEYERRHFHITEYTGEADFPEGKTLTILQLADLHDWHFGKNGKRLLRAVKSVSPDLIVASGDMLVCKGGRVGMEHALSLLRTLAENWPVFASNGNHEERLKKTQPSAYEFYTNELRNAGVHVLDNEAVIWKKNGICLKIAGLSVTEKEERHYKESKELFKKRVMKILAKKEKKAADLTVLLAHNPEYIFEYAQTPVDLIFAGHYHGGIIRVPRFGGLVSPKLKLFPPFSRGEFYLDDSRMIVSGGLGCHTIPLRLNNIPEIPVLRITGKTAGSAR